MNTHCSSPLACFPCVRRRAAAGHAGLLTADMVKDGACVIDVGINVGKDGKMTGDVDFDAVSEKAGMITPVPGGVGGVTTSILARSSAKEPRTSHRNATEVT